MSQPTTILLHNMFVRVREQKEALRATAPKCWHPHDRADMHEAADKLGDVEIILGRLMDRHHKEPRPE